jgi:hypothetical protein
MTLTVQVPTVGLANATEEPKIANTLTNLAAWSASIPDSDLHSPNNAVRRLVLQAGAIIDDSIGAGDRIFTADSFLVASGVQVYYPAPLWAGDAGYSSQPPDFQVPGKAAQARVRATLVSSTNSTVAFTVGLYQISGVGGSGRGISYMFAGAFPGSTVMVASPAAGVTPLESPEFALPTAPAAYALGVSLDSAPAAGAAVAITAQLYAYNT